MSALLKTTISAACLLSAFYSMGANLKPAQIRAPLLYHLAEFTRFPADRLLKQKINMCFLETPPFAHAKELEKAKKVTVNDTPLDIIKLTSIDTISTSNCHLLFISEAYESKQLIAQLQQINQKTLTVGESLSFVKDGGVMSIVPGNTTMKIVINMQQLKDSPFKINSAVVNLATLY